MFRRKSDTIRIKSSTKKVVVLKASPAADALAIAVGVLQQLQGMVDGDAATLKNAPEEIVKLVRKMIGQDKALIEALNGLVGNVKENDDKNKTEDSNKPDAKKTTVTPSNIKKATQNKLLR